MRVRTGRTAGARKVSGVAKPLYTKLKPGPGRSRQKVREHQQARLCGAMVELAAERGYENVTVRGLSRLAGVSTGTFYNHFDNVEHCFASTYESLMSRILHRAQIADREAGGGDAGLRAALTAFLTDLSSHPREARVALIEPYAAGPSMHPRIARAANSLARMIGAEAPPSVLSKGADRYISAGFAAAVTRVARTAVFSGDAQPSQVALELGEWIAVVRRSEAQDSTALSLTSRTPDQITDGLGEHQEPVLSDLTATADDERSRVRAAVAKLAIDGGSSNLTSARICAQAGISRRAFKHQFASITASLLDVSQAILTTTLARAWQAARRAPQPRAKVEGMISALCDDVARNPGLARLCYVEAPAAPREGLLRTDRWVSVAAEELEARASGRRNSNSQPSPEAALAAAWEIAHVDISAGRARELPALAPLISQVLLATNLALLRPGAEIKNIARKRLIAQRH